MAYKQFPMLGGVGDMSPCMVISIDLGRGSTPEVAQLMHPVKMACKAVSMGTLIADARYDSESNHEF